MTERIRAAEAARLLRQAAKKPKRVEGAQRTVTEDGSFDSRKEARRWNDLRLMQKAGLICGLQRQVRIPLMGQNGPILTPTGKQMVYIADFVYFEGSQQIIEDVKSGDHRTEVYLIKRAILAAMGITVREI